MNDIVICEECVGVIYGVFGWFFGVMVGGKNYRLGIFIS